MSDEREILLTTVDRIFGEIATPERLQETGVDHRLKQDWGVVEESGLTLALVAERSGGAGLGVPDALAIVRRAGAFALPLPLTETMIANRILTEAGFRVSAGVVTMASGSVRDRLDIQREGGGWHVEGTLERVPWARSADLLLAGTENALLLLPKGSFDIRRGSNLGDEPRDSVFIDARVGPEAVIETSASPLRLLRLVGAAARAIQMAGAIERVLQLTTDYVNERAQFGKSLGKFQAIQQYMAVLAGQVAAATVAADIAVDAFSDNYPELPIGIAKARTSEAAGIVCAIAHQTHGAMGIAREYPLQFYTRRLLSWRDEFGAEREWQSLIGRKLETVGPNGLWPLVTAI